MTGSPNYRLDGYEPADATVGTDFADVTLCDDQFVPLAEHHTADGRTSYLAFYDSAAIWGAPGAPAYVAMHLVRDTERHTFGFEADTHPVLPLAQRWLIARGCPADAIELTAQGQRPHPADGLTTQLEQRLKLAGDRYEVLDHHTHNPGTFDFGVETWTLTRDHDPASAELPYRLFIETVTKDLNTYMVREGAFPTAEAAEDWLDNHDDDTPLPQPARTRPGDDQQRAQAARARSSTNPASGNPTSPAASPPSARQRPAPRRSP